MLINNKPSGISHLYEEERQVRQDESNLEFHTFMKKKDKLGKMKVITMARSKNCYQYKKGSSGQK